MVLKSEWIKFQEIHLISTNNLGLIFMNFRTAITGSWKINSDYRRRAHDTFLWTASCKLFRSIHLMCWLEMIACPLHKGHHLFFYNIQSITNNIYNGLKYCWAVRWWHRLWNTFWESETEWHSGQNAAQQVAVSIVHPSVGQESILDRSQKVCNLLSTLYHCNCIKIKYKLIE